MKEKISVWTSPQICLELAVWPDHSKRQKVSLALEELTVGKRMLASHEFVILSDFAHLANKLIGEKCKVHLDFIEKIGDTNRIIYAGHLAHMAALKNYDSSPGINDVVKVKLLTKIKQLKIIINPRETLETLLLGGQNVLESESEFSKEYDNKSLNELEDEIKSLEDEFKTKGKDKKAANLFEKARKDIVKNYMFPFSYPPVLIALSTMENLCNILDYKSLVGNWSNFKTPSGSSLLPLSTELINKFQSDTYTLNNFREVLQLLFQSLVSQMMIPNIQLNFLLYEYEKALKQNTPSTSGLTIDVDHISAIYHCDVFLTYDQKLYSSINTGLKKLENTTFPKRYAIRDINTLRRLVN